ncbi:MAG: helix-turn-helix domain-containing protein, partial [Bifidobacteriaceae bacterium]|nr:helix-turn-helix domain-containing protein [Bifidobacteriaceae bacterium]
METVAHGPAGLGLEPFLDAAEVAAYLGVPLSTLYDWRTRGKGPVAHRFGKHLKFAVSDVREWVAAQRDRAAPSSACRAGARARYRDWDGQT